MTVRGQLPCTDQSLLRNDPMYGTASAGIAWALFELSGPWGHSAFLESPRIIDPTLGRAIARRVEADGMRVVAIRRHGRRPDPPRWRWFMAWSEEGNEALYGGEVSGPEEYLDLALDGSDGDRITEPLVAVCTHGKHDQCCAVRGRPSMASVAAAYPEQAWECSHIGGDRFAANMLILPDGLCYGRVDLTDAADIVARYDDGLVANEFLRGRSSVPHAVQAAQYFARERSGDDRIHAFAPIAVDRVDHHIEVRLAGDSGPVDVVLAERMTDPLLSTCSASVTGRVRTFVLVSITFA
ncbi:hypothetical protein GCM10009624_07770 [Gordonia sinesedis]